MDFAIPEILVNVNISLKDLLAQKNKVVITMILKSVIFYKKLLRMLVLQGRCLIVYIYFK
jgi:hypothetical protein